MIGPVLKYPGAKWNLAAWICSHLPPHDAYLEPYFGSGAVFFRKIPARLETINDLDGDVVNLFRVLRDPALAGRLTTAVALTPWARAEHEDAWALKRTGEPVEDARRLLVRGSMNYGMRLRRKGGFHAQLPGTAINKRLTAQWRDLPQRIAATCERLKDAQIECRPALDLLARYRHVNCLIYADPPYVLSTRSEAQYVHEMLDTDHEDLLDALDAHPGPVLLSGYSHELYDSRLGHWRRVTAVALAEGGRPRTEVLWLNPVAAEALEGRLF